MGRFRGAADPCANAAAVVPNDGTDLARASRALFVGVGGNIVVDLVESGSTITFKNVPDGSTLPLAVKRVRSTNTTATDIVALW